METGDWLAKTTAGDVMTRNLVKLKPGDPLATAADLLLREQISGAPVVDEADVCVGVLSASDFLRAEEQADVERDRIAHSSFWNSNLALPSSVYAERLEQVRDKLAPAAEQPVERFMTADLVTATEETPLENVVQAMVDAHIHRVVVVDTEQRLRGLISTTDVLAALLRAGR